LGVIGRRSATHIALCKGSALAFGCIAAYPEGEVEGKAGAEATGREVTHSHAHSWNIQGTAAKELLQRNCVCPLTQTHLQANMALVTIAKQAKKKAIFS